MTNTEFNRLNRLARWATYQNIIDNDIDDLIDLISDLGGENLLVNVAHMGSGEGIEQCIDSLDRNAIINYLEGAESYQLAPTRMDYIMDIFLDGSYSTGAEYMLLMEISPNDLASFVEYDSDYSTETKAQPTTWTAITESYHTARKEAI